MSNSSLGLAACRNVSFEPVNESMRIPILSSHIGFAFKKTWIGMSKQGSSSVPGSVLREGSYPPQLTTTHAARANGSSNEPE